MDKQKTASCIGARAGGIRRSARIRAAKAVDLGIDSGVLAAEIAKFVAAEERSDHQATRPWEREDGGTTRNARISVANPVDLSIDPGVLAAGVAEFVAAAERRQARGPCKSENDEAMMRGARISVAGPVDLGVDPGGRRVRGGRTTGGGEGATQEVHPRSDDEGVERMHAEEEPVRDKDCSVSWRSS